MKNIFYIVTGLLLSLFAISESEAAPLRWHCSMNKMRAQDSDGHQLYSFLGYYVRPFSAVLVSSNMPLGVVRAESNVSLADCVHKMRPAEKVSVTCSTEYYIAPKTTASKSKPANGIFNINYVYSRNATDIQTRGTTEPYAFDCIYF